MKNIRVYCAPKCDVGLKKQDSQRYIIKKIKFKMLIIWKKEKDLDVENNYMETKND